MKNFLKAIQLIIFNLSITVLPLIAGIFFLIVAYKTNTWQLYAGGIICTGWGLPMTISMIVSSREDRH